MHSSVHTAGVPHREGTAHLYGTYHQLSAVENWKSVEEPVTDRSVLSLHQSLRPICRHCRLCGLGSKYLTMNILACCSSVCFLDRCLSHIITPGQRNSESSGFSVRLPCTLKSWFSGHHIFLTSFTWSRFYVPPMSMPLGVTELSQAFPVGLANPTIYSNR